MTTQIASAKLRVVEALHEAGIASGDIILVHSDTSLAMKMISADWWETALLFLEDCFKKALGENGTLIVPTFNYDFCHGKPYHNEQSPSQVGLFSEHIRRNPAATRSFHPIFSFAAIGARAHELCNNVSKSSFGRNSVFDRIFHANTKIVFLNTSFESCTFAHYVEQQKMVSYRYLKYFTGEVSVNNKRYTDTFDFFVRYLDLDVKTFLTPLANLLEQKGLMRRVPLDGGYILQVSCSDVYREALCAMNENPYFLIANPPKPMPPFLSEDISPKGKLFHIKDLVSKLYPLHRTLVSDGTDRALSTIGDYLPSSVAYSIETYAPTKQVWTWRVPERYVVHKAYLETEDGQPIVNFKHNPLHLISYSVSIDKILDWKELEPHLHYSVKRLDAIPWEFKYYERDWGFCLSKKQFDKLPRNKRYHAVIRSEFIINPEQGLCVGVAKVSPQGGSVAEKGEILVCAHICHPYQANDDISGIATILEVIRRFSERPLPADNMNIRFLFCPETIGSICYLSHHEDLILCLRGGVFVEMTGNRNSIVLQHTRQNSHLMDRIAHHLLKSRVKEFREGGFREIVGNDEMVINGPGVNIPCISLSRYPYDEYHTSDDNPTIIHEDMMLEMADILEEIIRIYASNYIPSRTFKGPVFLSGYGLWIDWRVNEELNRVVEKIMLLLEGKDSIFDIAEKLNLNYWMVRDYIEKFRTKGLVRSLPISGSVES